MVKPRKYVKPIGVKWMFRVKKDNMGKTIRHKERLVVKGYVQKHGIDYDELFSTVARLESIKILIAIVKGLIWPKKSTESLELKMK